MEDTQGGMCWGETEQETEEENMEGVLQTGPSIHYYGKCLVHE